MLVPSLFTVVVVAVGIGAWLMVMEDVDLLAPPPIAVDLEPDTAAASDRAAPIPTAVCATAMLGRAVVANAIRKIFRTLVPLCGKPVTPMGRSSVR